LLSPEFRKESHLNCSRPQESQDLGLNGRTIYEQLKVDNDGRVCDPREEEESTVDDGDSDIFDIGEILCNW
jgi:hypothetical protein